MPDIEPAKQKPDPDLIEHIEEILVKAKAGEITGLVEATLYHGQSCGSGWCIGSAVDALILLGELTRLQHQLMLGNKGFRQEVKDQLDIQSDDVRL